jgi:AAA domain
MRISNVFTPRSPDVNLDMYVPRPILETALAESVQGSMHSLLFGESGNGKSWLYKKVLDEEFIPFAVVNCANASRRNSLTQEIWSVAMPEGSSSRTSYSEKKEAGVSAGFASGKIEQQAQYQVRTKEPLLEAFDRLGATAKSKPFVLVFDNLESIFSQPSLMNELADIVILCDDKTYASTRVKLLIVGVPNGVLDYFSKTKNLASVSNRIEELPPVEGLSPGMVGTVVEKGLNHLLAYALKPNELLEVSIRVHHVTMGVAQCVHEYLAKFAALLEKAKRSYSPQLLRDADAAWLRLGLRHCYSVIESHLNNKRTAISRRNQVIYCIGHMDTHQFNSGDVKQTIEGAFPRTVGAKNMGIGSILGELASGDRPLLKRNPQTNEYRVVDPRYLMCIRVALWVDYESQSVFKGNFEFE